MIFAKNCILPPHIELYVWSLLPEGHVTISEKEHRQPKSENAVWQNPIHALHRSFLPLSWELNVGERVASFTSQEVFVIIHSSKRRWLGLGTNGDNDKNSILDII